MNNVLITSRRFGLSFFYLREKGSSSNTFAGASSSKALMKAITLRLLIVIALLQLSACGSLQQQVHEIRKANQIVQMDNALWEYGSKYEGNSALTLADRSSLIAIALDAEEQVKNLVNANINTNSSPDSKMQLQMAISYLRIALTAQELITRNQLKNTQVTRLANDYRSLCEAQMQSVVLQRDCFFVQAAPFISMIGKMAYASGQNSAGGQNKGFEALVPGATAYQVPGEDITSNPALKEQFDFWVKRSLLLSDLVIALDCKTQDIANNESLQNWCLDIKVTSSQFLASWLQDIYQILENASGEESTKQLVKTKQNALD